MAGLSPKPRAGESERGGLGWLLTLVTGQVWLIPELGRILDKLDIALALLHGGLYDREGLSLVPGLLSSHAMPIPEKQGSPKVATSPPSLEVFIPEGWGLLSRS